MTHKGWLSIAAACLVLQLTGCAMGAKAPGMTVLAQESALVSNEAFTGGIAVGEVSIQIPCGNSTSARIN